ncbi:hypothetical protein [Buttiauxella agrestis]|uniref:hypothetical protein n=1 Tax=Buttiauxella agrestis TaxID=82977 RepID=UPI003975DF71
MQTFWSAAPGVGSTTGRRPQRRVPERGDRGSDGLLMPHRSGPVGNTAISTGAPEEARQKGTFPPERR